ncbi:MAG: FkbM family methyltransferase [Desulfomonilaceae bacterium]|nr:FkbM family methyltransferase [Desulfomonilaceae bacterium]
MTEPIEGSFDGLKSFEQARRAIQADKAFQQPMIKKYIKRLVASTGSLIAEGALSAYSAHEMQRVKYLEASAYVACRTTFGHMVVCKKDMVIGSGFMNCGDFGTSQITNVITIIKQFVSDFQTRCFLDVGANIGGHGIFALKSSFQRAIFIEPDPLNFRLLRVNQIINNVDSRCTNFEIAASNTDGPLTLERSEDNLGDHRIRNHVFRGRPNLYDEESRSCVQVDGRSIDSLVEHGEIAVDDVDLSWLDTQGYEGNVLAGAESLLNRRVPMVVEFWPYALERVGGYDSLHRAISAYEHIVDVGASEQSKELVTVGPSELDSLYSALLKAERPPTASQTDLLLF